MEARMSQARSAMGWILVRKGYVKEGTAVLRHAVELGEGRTEIRYHLATGLAAWRYVGGREHIAGYSRNGQ